MITADKDHREQTAQHIYRLKIDAIKWQMQIDLDHMLASFAAKWGIER